MKSRDGIVSGIVPVSNLYFQSFTTVNTKNTFVIQVPLKIQVKLIIAGPIENLSNPTLSIPILNYSLRPIEQGTELYARKPIKLKGKEKGELFCG